MAAQNDAAAVARATQEIQAALVIAQRFPRDEVRVKSRILEACKRKDLAEVSEYEYSRGGTKITGPTVDLLRAIANRWGNIRYGWTEVERRDGQSMVRCFAWDMQSNGQAERTFSVKHWRDTQGGGYELKDERDIYELLANMAARRVRACLEEVIDADVVSSAIDQCRLTIKSGEKTPLADRAVQMLSAFMEMGVTQPMIEGRLQNKLEAISENQLASLRRIYKSLKDGVGKREDYLKPETSKPEFAGSSTTATAQTVANEREEAAAGLAPVQPSPAAASPAQRIADAPGNGKTNYVKAVRNLAKLAKIDEGFILDYLSATGSTDGSVGSLEELSTYESGGILASVHDSWSSVSMQIKDWLKSKEEEK